MNKKLDELWNQIETTSGDEQIKSFIQYCSRLVELKEAGELSEEEAAYKMMGALHFDTLANSPICNDIFDIAGTTELPRITSYTQPIGSWNEKTAEQIKRKEWRMLVVAIEKAKTVLHLG